MASPSSKLDVSVIPPFPAVLSHIVRLAKTGDVSTGEIAAVVRQDAGLAARVLRACRSPAFSRGAPALTIEEAAGRLGVAEINRIALALGMADFSKRPITAYSRPSQYFWERSVTTAIIMEYVSPNDNQAYMTGLMHLVGVWVLNRVPQSAQPIDAQNMASQAALEQNRFGVAYPEAGCAALTAWGFDDHVAQAVAAQLNPKTTEGSPWEGLARDLAISVCATDLQSGHHPKIPAWLGRKIDDDYLASIVTEVAERVDVITHLYRQDD
jgi:HD-like signal output (HDOD) protein